MVHPPCLGYTVSSPVTPGTSQACAAGAFTVSTRAILGKSQQDLKTFLRLLLPRWLSFCPMESQVVPGREAWRWSLVLGTAIVKDGQEREEGASHEEHGERPGDAQYLQRHRAT
jgi:hypothetical protein